VKKKTATPKEHFFGRVGEFVEKGEWETIQEEGAALLEDGESCGELLFLLGLAAFMRHDFAGAVAHAKQAYDIEPGVTEYCDLLATLHGMAGDINSASFFVKMASVGASSPKLAGWLPKSLPTFTEAFFEARTRPFFRQAVRSLSIGNWVDAEHWFSQHLAFHPKDAEAHAGLANALMVQGLYAAAVEHLRAARHVVPSDAKVASLLGTALTAVGQFAEAQAVHRSATAADAAGPAVRAAAIGDLLADPATEPQAIAVEIQRWARDFGVSPDALPPRRSMGSPRRLTVGYVIGMAGRSHSISFLTEILARHDAQRFRVIGFGAGQLSDPSNVVFQKCFEAWGDTGDADPLTFASMVRAENVDVLVDVSGFTSPTLLRAFGARMAPVQAVWSPLFYGMAPRNVDVLMTDAFLDPLGGSSAVAGESLCRLEMGGVVIAPSPQQPEAGCGEPHGPVYAADATLGELNVPTVEAWAQILAAVPGAVLLLRDHGFRSGDVGKRLIGLFGNFGLAHRIDLVSVPEPAEFFAGADVCLLPYQSMRPEVAINALAAGLPVVNWSGVGRHRRLVGSVLNFAGLAAEMVAESAGEYRDKAVAWMNATERREAFRSSIRDRLAKAPVFNAAGRAADLERAYLNLHKTVTVAGSA
jgi:predicted O-linked N-acetylglucosamine transferase (SPINDLY family)